MPSDKEDLYFVIDCLVDFGVFNLEGCKRLADVFRAMKDLSALAEPSKRSYRKQIKDQPTLLKEPEQGEEVGETRPLKLPPENRDNGKESVEKASEQPQKKTRKPRASLNITQFELEGLLEGMTISQIARLKGVSVGTIRNRMKEFGI